MLPRLLLVKFRGSERGSSISRFPWKAAPSAMNCSSISVSMPRHHRFPHSTSSAPSSPYITGQVAFKEQKRRHVHQVDFSLDFKTCRHFLRLHSGGPAGCGRPNQKSTLFLSGPVNCNDKNDYPLLVVFLNLSITLRLPSLL